MGPSPPPAPGTSLYPEVCGRHPHRPGAGARAPGQVATAARLRRSLIRCGDSTTGDHSEPCAMCRRSPASATPAPACPSTHPSTKLQVHALHVDEDAKRRKDQPTAAEWLSKRLPRDRAGPPHLRGPPGGAAGPASLPPPHDRNSPTPIPHGSPASLGGGATTGVALQPQHPIQGLPRRPPPRRATHWHLLDCASLCIRQTRRPAGRRRQ